MFRRLSQYLELIRFSRMLFALLNAALARQDEPFRRADLAEILLCMVFARSAAMAFNRLADRRLDTANPRTAGRHFSKSVSACRPAAPR